jgi:hypothetical protein
MLDAKLFGQPRCQSGLSRATVADNHNAFHFY